MKKIIALIAALAVVLLGLVLPSTVPAFATQGGETDCRETIRVIDEEAWTEEVEHPAETHVVHHDAVTHEVKVVDSEAVPSVWQNFSPNDQQATFVGPPSWPTDVRGTWHHEDKEIPPGHAGPDGVYAQGNPDKGGNWFYRHAAVAEVSHFETVIDEEAYDETVIDKEPWTEYIEHEATYKEIANPDYNCPEEEDPKPWVCHPVNGNGELGNGWNLIDPSHFSSHIDEENNNAPKHTPPTFWASDTLATYDGEGDPDEQSSYSCPEPPDEPEVIEIPATPTQEDPCGDDNAFWNVPADTDVLDWDNTEGVLTVTIIAENTVFTDESTSHEYGVAVDSGRPCPPNEVALPVAPSVTDECGEGNAAWNVPADTETLDWELVEGEAGLELVVSIIPENTVFEGTEDTEHNFGVVTETNTEPCPEITDFDATAQCVSNIPYFAYDLNVVGTEADDVTITFINPNGPDKVYANKPLSGKFLWPGAGVSPDMWPGWDLVNGEYVDVGNANFGWTRDNVQVKFEVNPTATTTVAYPEATSACANPPKDDTPPSNPPKEPREPRTPFLPNAGMDEGGFSLLLGLAILLMLAGGGLLAVRKRA